jgi:hypothetical protein
VTPKIKELKPMRAIRDALRLSESILLEKGYQVELNRTIAGKSGEPREVDIIAKDDGKTFILDMSEWGKEEDLINLLGKKMDVEPKAAILLDLSRSEKILQQSEVYDIKAFNAKEPEFEEKFSEYVDSFNETVEEEARGFFSRLFGRRSALKEEQTKPETPRTASVEVSEQKEKEDEETQGQGSKSAIPEKSAEPTYSKSELSKMLKQELQEILIKEFNETDEDMENLTKAKLTEFIISKQKKPDQDL